MKFLLVPFLLVSLLSFSQKRKVSKEYDFKYQIGPEFIDSICTKTFKDSLEYSGESFFDPESPYFVIWSKEQLNDERLQEILWCMYYNRRKSEYRTTNCGDFLMYMPI